MDRLPNELLLGIISQLSYDESHNQVHASLNSLRGVSKWFCKLVSPIAFEHYDLHAPPTPPGDTIDPNLEPEKAWDRNIERVITKNALYAKYATDVRTLNVRLRTVSPDSRAYLPTMISPFNNIVHFKLSRDGNVFSSYVSWKDLITLLGCVVTSSPSLKTISLSKGPRQNLMPGDFDTLRQLIQKCGVVCSPDHLRFELRSMKKMEKRSVYLYSLLSFLVGISKSTELVLQDRDSPLLYRDRPRPEDEYDIKFDGQVEDPLLPDLYEPRLRKLRWEVQWMPLRLRQYTNPRYLEKVKILEYQAPIIRLMKGMEDVIWELAQFKELEEFRFHSTQVPDPSDDENTSTRIMDKWMPFAERIFNSLPRLRSVKFYGEYAETGFHNGDFEYQRVGMSEEKRHTLQVRPIFTK